MAERPWGRIRVRYDQAVLYYRLLWEERGRLTFERSRWKNQKDALPGFNRAIALVDSSKEELERLADEQGWDLRGQSGASDPQTANSGQAD